MGQRKKLTRSLFVGLVTVLLVFPPLDVYAGHCGLLDGFCQHPTPSPTPTPDPTPPPSEPDPTPPPTAKPKPTPTPGLLPELDPDDLEEPEPSPDAGEDAEGGDGVEVEKSELPAGLQFVEVPRIARTPPRNTAHLVGLLEPLTELGVSLQQVLMEGMGSFPVAGLAFYSDDWLNPRFDGYELPVRLHRGLDIFADFGTPVRAPVPGRITRFSTGGKGGIGVWMADEQGTSYYFAHLLARPDDLVVGQEVQVGDLLGFVGDSGNARGGAPHLHMEIHRGESIPPKPWVDQWLDEAIEAAPAWVSAQRERILEATGRLDSGNGPAGLAGMETSMLLALLDPVGGSVGMLPSLNISPRRSTGLSEALTEDLIRSRIEGGLLIPSSREVYLRH